MGSGWFGRDVSRSTLATSCAASRRSIDRLANPAYVLLLVTSVLMVLVGGIPFETFWIAASIGLWLVLVVLGLGVYTPTLGRQIALVESAGMDSPEYGALARRGIIVGAMLAVIVTVIVFLMVTKPTL